MRPGKRSRLVAAAATLAGVAAATALLRKLLARRRSPLRASAGAGLALITGASSGLGAEYARQLAARGFDLVLVARRAERLEQLAADLSLRYGVQVETLPADLSKPEGTAAVVRRTARLDNLTLLVNNAGIDIPRRFMDVEIERLAAENQLHIDAALRLCHAALPAMLRQKRGAVINVASLSAFSPISGNSVYAASKAYLVIFTEALAMELMGSGVYAQALCPGLTHTEFHNGAEFDNFRRIPMPEIVWMKPQAVVRASLNSLGSGEVVVVPGAGNALIVTLNRLPLVGRILPRFISVMRNLTSA